MQIDPKTISESAEFDRWFRAINRTRRASGVRPRTRAEAVAIYLAAAPAA